MSITQAIWKQLQQERRNQERERSRVNNMTEIAGEAFQFRTYATLTDAPTGLSQPENGFILSGRKPGEGAGNGTGVPAFYNPATNSWLNFHDCNAVTE